MSKQQVNLCVSSCLHDKFTTKEQSPVLFGSSCKGKLPPDTRCVFPGKGLVFKLDVECKWTKLL